MVYAAHPQATARTGTRQQSPPLEHTSTATSYREAENSVESGLAERILQRIEARLPGRVRHLTVCFSDNAVALAGECSTYYTKQLAQHVAMGILEYEQLVNNIEVSSPC